MQMFSGNVGVIIADIENKQDNQGNYTKVVASARRLIMRLDITGLQTQQIAQVQGFTAVKTLEVSRTFYDDQKYLCYKDKNKPNYNVYQIFNVSKASKPTNLLLNVTKIVDSELMAAFDVWRVANDL